MTRLSAKRVRFSTGLLAVLCLTFAHAAHAQTAVPTPWHQDIGAPALAGNAVLAQGRYTITAGGTDIWSTNDQFHFVFKQVTGNLDVRARLASFDAADGWAKAGVMVRETLADSSAHAFAMISGANGYDLQYRRTAAGPSDFFPAGAGAAPGWVRLVRTGNHFDSYRSADGAAWTLMSSVDMPMAAAVYVGLSVTSHNPAQQATAVVDNWTVAGTVMTEQAPPAGQLHADIGAPRAGSATLSQGQYSITAGGVDIWGASDQLHFVYQPVTGDVDVRARVASLTAADGWTKGGVMVRATLDPASANTFSILSATSGYGFSYRAAAAGSTVGVVGDSGLPAGWVRLVRIGQHFDSYKSLDGQTWTLMGSTDVSMPQTVLVGLAVTAHTASAMTTARIDNLTVSAATATNQPPSVALTAPAAGSAGAAPASVTLSATASDPEGRLSRVDFYANASLVGSDATAPYSMVWSSVAAGSYALTARAYDANGGTTTSSAVSITVGGTNQLPTVALTAPAGGASAVAPAAFTLSATASDPEGRLSRVEFRANGTLVGSDATSPYSIAWSSVAAGSYSVTATAFDADGGSRVSTAVSVTVTAAPVTAWRAIFTASADHAANVTSYRLNVFAAGANTSTATPLATSDLGKPTPDGTNVITVNQASFINALAPGSYQATVAAVGPGGSTQSVPATFTR